MTFEQMKVVQDAFSLPKERPGLKPQPQGLPDALQHPGFLF
jgi:hypothetical protein